MNQEKAMKWAVTREIGKSKYMLRYGILAMGLSIACLLTLIEWTISKQITPIWVLIRILVFSIIGSFVFNVRWEKQESKFVNYKKNNKEA